MSCPWPHKRVHGRAKIQSLSAYLSSTLSLTSWLSVPGPWSVPGRQRWETASPPPLWPHGPQSSGGWGWGSLPGLVCFPWQSWACPRWFSLVSSDISHSLCSPKIFGQFSVSAVRWLLPKANSRCDTTRCFQDFWCSLNRKPGQTGCRRVRKECYPYAPKMCLWQ